MTVEKQDIIIYQSTDGEASFNVNVFEETVWLTQKQMAKLFETTRENITLHINNIYSERELDQKATSKDFLLVQKEGIRDIKRNIIHYNLDVIVSVGYRVNSSKATQFRRWATQILKQYMMNGYAINETRIKQIESSIDELVESNKIIKEDVDGIKNLLIKLIERPIVIHNHNHNQVNLMSNKLEEKIIELLDELIEEVKSNKALKSQLEEIKENIKTTPKNQKSKDKILKFFKNIGDNNSDIHKTIKGVGGVNQILKELIKLGEKIKDLFL
jgi:hypothetical protein